MPPSTGARAVPAENRLLAALPKDEREHLQHLLQTVQLRRGQVLILQGEPLQMVCFPITAVLSLVSVLQNGSSTEIGTVGSEGMVGVPAFLGPGSAPYKAMVQIPGTARLMHVVTLDAEVGDPGPLRDLLLRYTQVFLDNMTQQVACSRHHMLKRRFATWLLTHSDRIGSNRVPVTQGYVGQMLGVGRPSVNLAAGAMQRAGLVSLKRGCLTILDRPGLEAVACECYHVMRHEYDHLFA